MKRFEQQWQDFKWIDIEGSPTQDEFLQLSEEFSIPLHPLATSLDPEHLPKLQTFDNICFMILRLYDEAAKGHAGSMQALSTKLIVFFGKDFVLTIHRSSMNCIQDQKNKAPFEQRTLDSLIKSFFERVIMTYDHQLDDLEAKTEVIEGRVFALRRRNILREGYQVKRRASVFRKIFKFTSDVLTKLPTIPNHDFTDLTDIKEPLDRYIFYVESIYEDITGLLSLHLSLMSQKTNEASFKTNEIMRVLTVVSIFFLPLNFIAGVYGMNFEHMPELKTPHGYYITLGVMLTIAIGIFAWVYRKGWVKKEDL